ncbi:MAG TPA: MFS transporter [Methylomirabilota bacterium]|jgi:MFS family permease|nr:MFS transporter [Methylomirabilota bacterium]
MRPDGWLLAVCLARALMTSIFMTYAAALPVLRPAWGMSATAAGSISTGSQLGYAVSLVVFSSLADRLGARRVFVSSAWLSAIAALAFAFGARSYVSGLVLYTLVAVSQGGAYTTAIMLIADRYPPERRGSAVGWLIASSSLGYALSLVVSGIALSYGYEVSFVVAACGPLLGACMLVLALRTTPNVVHPRRTGLRFGSAVVRNARAMRLMLGYTFHSWELLGMWAWVPAFLAAAFAAGGAGERAVTLGAYLSASFQVMGLVASSSMGRLSDRLGRRTVLFGLAASSAACSFVFGWLIGAPIALVFAVGALYSFTALGDSPVLSTALTEAVEPPYLGAALALRSFLGFGAGAIAPLVFGAVLDATNPAGIAVGAWGWAFVTLGIGGAAAAACAWSLPPDRRPALAAASRSA